MKKFVSLIITITILLSAGCSIPAALDEMLTGDETAQDTPSNLDTARQETNATATPTVAPEVRLESADDYLFAGDLENALMRSSLRRFRVAGLRSRKVRTGSSKPLHCMGQAEST